MLTTAPPCQVLFHVWLEHGALWQEVLAGHTARQGADPSGPPPDLPKKMLVRSRPCTATGRRIASLVDRRNGSCIQCGALTGNIVQVTAHFMAQRLPALRCSCLYAIKDGVFYPQCRDHVQAPDVSCLQAAIRPSPAQKAAMIVAFQDMATSTQALFPVLLVCLKTEPDAGLAALASDAISVSSPLFITTLATLYVSKRPRLAAG